MGAEPHHLRSSRFCCTRSQKPRASPDSICADAGAVAEGDLFHFAALGVGGKLVAIAAAHVRHIDAQDPQQAVAFAGRDFAQRAEHAFDLVVRFGRASAVDAIGVGAAENRHDADFRSKKVLQEDDLKFDRVLDRVAVIFHGGGVAGFILDFVDEAEVGDGFAVGGRERLAGEAEAVGLAVMGGAENHESAFGVGGREGGVGCAIGVDASEGADVGGGDGD